MNEITLKKDIAKFGDHMKKGAAHIAKACAIYADAVANDHTAAYAFQDAYPYITESTWDKMRLAGLGAMEPKILLLSDRLANKLIRLPINKQREIVCDDIEIIKDEKVVKKNIRHMSKKEQKLAFDDKMNKRTVDEQKTVIVLKRKTTVPYQIEGCTLKVNRACILSLKELKLIVSKLS